MILPLKAGCFTGSPPRSLGDFSTEQIKVVPHIRVPTAGSQGLPVGMAPELPAGDPADLNIPEGDLTEKDCIELTMICVNIPGMFGNPHLERSEAQCTPFGRQLHRYCQKKGIDPSDYIFDEFGMVVTGVGLVGGMWADHKAFRAANPKNKPAKDRTDDKTVPKSGIFADQLPEDEEKT